MILALVHFNAVDTRYLDAALASIAKQRNLSEYVDEILILDNDTPTSILALEARRDLLDAWVDVPVTLVCLKHGDVEKRCHSWSVNEVFRRASDTRAAHGTDWVMFTRSDYILDFTIVEKFGQQIYTHTRDAAWRGFVTSYAYHMAYDERGDQRVLGMRDISTTGWKTDPQVLLEKVNGWKVDSSHTDAGVWVTRKSLWAEVGGLNERMVAWGLQQTVFQQTLKDAGVEIVQIPEYLFFHQHHGGTFRDYDVAVAELEAHWGPREQLSTFRNIEQFVGKVCDELGPAGEARVTPAPDPREDD